MSPDQIRDRLDAGRWRLERRGVYRVVGARQTWLQAVRIAVVAAGDQAIASHSTAARLFGAPIDEEFGIIELSAPLGRQIRLAGVRSHRSGHIAPADIVHRSGIPCTSPVRLVIDLSGRLSDERLGWLVDELLRRRLIKLPDLRVRVSALRPAPGRSVSRLRRVLADRPEAFSAGESELEGRISRVLLRNGFPSPVSQHWVRAGGRKARLDFAYPEVKTYLEGDGFGFHSTASDLDNDARRRNWLLAQGWHGLVFTWRMSDAEIVESFDAIYDRATSSWRQRLFV
jgi:hypothetical protein